MQNVVEANAVFSTGQSVRPEGGRRWTALSGPVRSFSKLALRPSAKDYRPRRPPAVHRETCFMLRNTPELVRNLASGQDCLCHPSFPQCLEAGIFLLFL